MKKLITVIISLAFLLSLSMAPAWAGGGKVRSEKASGPAGETGGGKVQTTRGH